MVTKNQLLTTLASEKKALTPAEKKALEAYFPQAFLPKVQKIKTVAQALEAGTGSLAKITKHVGEQRTLALIKLYLVRTNDLLNLKRPLSEPAIDELARIILSEYYMLHMVDVVFVLNQGMKGKFGELYDALTIPKIMKWFEVYYNERCNEAEVLSDKQRHRYNSCFAKERSSDQTRFKEFFHNYTLKKYKEKK